MSPQPQLETTTFSPLRPAPRGDVQHVQKSTAARDTCMLLQHTAPHCNTQERTATHCNALQRAGTYCNTHTPALVQRVAIHRLAHETCVTATRCNTLQHAATRCNTLQHAATRCNTLQHAATRCNTLQDAATCCNTLQHAATHCKTPQCNATHCNALHNTQICSGAACSDSPLCM